MTLSPVPVESFAGLNLVDDPGEIGWHGAVDLLNVDFDKHGRVRSRDGYSKFTSAANANTLSLLAPLPSSSQLVAFTGATATAQAYNAAGAAVGAAQALGAPGTDMAVFGGTAGTKLLVAAGGGAVVLGWNGAAWSTVWTPGVSAPYFMAVQSPDNRAVYALYDANQSRVAFSNPGDPTTVGANNWIDLRPGNGESINAVVSWRELVFVFKETCFFCFYGNSTDSSGNPIFNVRAVDTGIGAGPWRTLSPGRLAVASPQGVYFLNSRGVYLTNGGPPVCVSRAIDGLFLNTASSFFASNAINQARLATAVLCYHNERLYIAFASGSSTTNDRLLVLDPNVNLWTLFDIPCAGLASWNGGTSGLNSLYFSYATGTKDIGKHSSASTDDNGTAITSRYRSGFNTLPPSLRADGKRVIRQWGLRGSGTVTFGVAADDAVAIPTTAGGAQSSVSLTAARPNYRTSQIGNNASWQVSSTSAWRLDSLQADLA